MAFAALRPEERIGLAVAIALHAALVAALLLQPKHARNFPIPERMAVNLVDDVGLEATGPVLSQDAQAAVAPEISEEIAPPEPVQERPVEKPVTKPVTKPVPEPRTTPAPSPKPKPAPAPKPKAVEKPVPAKPAPKSGGGSKLGSDFLQGVDAGEADADAPMPASQIGTQAKASLAQAIGRQLKPHWSSPQGADAELLVTVLAFDLNRDGTLAGPPRVVSQSGITDANRAQAGRHAELAIRAVQLAAPFDLPVKYYNAWKRVSAFRFDRKLSQ
ncbi:MAG: energy transducer TonB [Novosphingobium sp.]|nr:energy transducer TonB [Novosphingobium sp.]